jgi:hypothetical protein
MSIRTTGQKVESLEAGLNHLRQFPISEKFNGRFNYAMLMQEDDESFTIVERVGMPCWGALREYEKGTRPTDPWPFDLRTDHHLFPSTGKPVAVAAFFAAHLRLPNVKLTGPEYLYSNTSIEDWNKFIEFVFNPDISPWKAALKGFELIKNEHGYYQGVVLTDTNIDPNIMIAMLRQNVNMTSKAANWAQLLRDKPQLDPRVAYLMTFTGDGYYFNPRIILSSFFKGEPVDISGGSTFYERESYNRPDISFIFGGKNNTGVVFKSMTEEQLTKELENATSTA